MEARATDNVLQIRTLGSLGIEEQLTASGQAIIERAENMRIGNAREYEDAAAFLVEIKKRSKQMKEYWKPSKDAAKAAHARICEQEKAMLAPMERAERTIKAGMARYQTAEAEARREAEWKAIKRQQIERDRLMNEAAEAEQAGDMHGAAISMAMAEMVEEQLHDVGLFRRWARAHYPEIVKYFGAADNRELGLLGAVVNTKHQIDDVLKLQDRVERDAIDGQIDPTLRDSYRRELEEAREAIETALGILKQI